MKKYILTFFIAFLALFGLFTKLVYANRYKASDVMMMATVIWHEAGGSGYKEMQKVANAIINRYEKFEGHGKDGYQIEIGDILTYTNAFQGSAAYLNSRMTDEDIKRYVVGSKSGKSQLNSQSWKDAYQLAQLALSGQLEDITHGATHFQVCNLNKNNGYWAAMKAAGNNAYAIKGVSTNTHCFYRGIGMGAMKVNGHIVFEGKVSGRFSKGGGGKINVHQGGGSGEGVGAKAQTYLGANNAYANHYRKLGLIPGQAGGAAGTGGGEWGGYTSVSGEGGGYGGGGGGSYGGPIDNGGFTSLDLTLGFQEYQQMCAAAKTETDGSTTPPNVFNTQILVRMTQMMEKIYISLGQLYAVGQSLMCFAIDVAPIKKFFIKFINLPYWLTGLLIYLAAFFITMSIGLFFVDITFKLGFALLMLPISIALWPFEPTRGKLSENFSIIIRNSMLFALVAIGIGYAVILIQNGVLHGIDEATFAKAMSDNSAKQMAKEFAMSGAHVLIILFCLIYGYKIIQSSVNDYLNRIFPDNVFGGQSHMHHLGVQAMGTVATHTVLPAASLTADIARNQVGRGLQYLGRGLQSIGGRGPTPPQPASGAGGHGPNGPLPANNFEPDNQREIDAIPGNDFVETANESADEAQMPVTPDKNADNRHNNRGQKQETLADRRKQNERNRRQNKNNAQNPQNIGTNQLHTQQNPEDTKETPNAFAGNGADSGITTGEDNIASTGLKGAFAAGVALGKQDTVENYSLSPGNLLKNTANATLNILTAPLNAKTYHQLVKLGQMHAAQQNKRDAAENAMMPNMTANQKIVMRLSRDATLFMRTAKQTARNTVVDTGKETARVTGSLLEKFGEKIRPSKKDAHGMQYWREWMDRRNKEEINRRLEEKDQRETDSTLADDYVDRGGK